MLRRAPHEGCMRDWWGEGNVARGKLEGASGAPWTLLQNFIRLGCSRRGWRGSGPAPPDSHLHSLWLSMFWGIPPPPLHLDGRRLRGALAQCGTRWNKGKNFGAGRTCGEAVAPVKSPKFPETRMRDAGGARAGGRAGGRRLPEDCRAPAPLLRLLRACGRGGQPKRPPRAW